MSRVLEQIHIVKTISKQTSLGLHDTYHNGEHLFGSLRIGGGIAICIYTITIGIGIGTIAVGGIGISTVIANETIAISYHISWYCYSYDGIGTIAVGGIGISTIANET